MEPSVGGEERAASACTRLCVGFPELVLRAVGRCSGCPPGPAIAEEKPVGARSGFGFGLILYAVLERQVFVIFLFCLSLLRSGRLPRALRLAACRVRAPGWLARWGVRRTLDSAATDGGDIRPCGRGSKREPWRSLRTRSSGGWQSTLFGLLFYRQ